MTLRPVLLAVACALAGAPAAAHGQQRELSREHDGSLGLFAALGAEYANLVVADCFFCGESGRAGSTIVGVDALLDVGGTMAVGPGGELLARFRLVFLSPARGESVLFGYRKYWGKDELKTFLSFDLMGTFRPVQTFGARPGFGVMWDFSPVVGAWLDAAGTFGIGRGRRFAGELTVGLQARSYLLE